MEVDEIEERKDIQELHEESDEEDEEFDFDKVTNLSWVDNQANPETVEINNQFSDFENNLNNLLEDLDSISVGGPTNSVAEISVNHKSREEELDDMVSDAVNNLAKHLENLAGVLHRARDNIEAQTRLKIANEHPYEVVDDDNNEQIKENLDPQSQLWEYATAIAEPLNDLSEDDQYLLLEGADLFVSTNRNQIDLNHKYFANNSSSELGIDLLHLAIDSVNLDWVILLLKHSVRIEESHLEFAHHKFIKGLERKRDGDTNGKEKDERRISQLLSIHKTKETSSVQ